MASNLSTITDPNGEFDDWVELYNSSGSPVNMAGYYMSDNTANLIVWQFPSNNAAATTIPAGGYMIVWFDNQAAQGPLHAIPKLSASGEAVVLTAPNGTTIVDSISFGAQIGDVSMGRIPNGTGSFISLAPTPGALNVNTPPQITAATPVATVNAGFYTTAQTVALSSTTPGAVIRYTLDGSLPTATSTLYTAPIVISSTKTLRAVAFANLYQNSPSLSNTYFINVSHTFPVVSLSSDPDNFFGTANGIYPNYTQEIEQPVHFELFEGSNMTLESDAKMKIQGTASATLPQKSISIKASVTPSFNYPLFPSLPFSSYGAFVVHNSGQDWNITMFRDAVVTGLLREFDDIAPMMKKPDLDLQGYRPGVVYINGAYWGIHNLRERMNDVFVKTHYGLSASQIDMIENQNEIKEGDLNEWNAFESYYTNTNFSTAANFNALKAKMDMDNWLDYNVFEIYADNEDWPGNNLLRFRERTPTGQWRWMCKDFDFTFGLYQQGGGWNTGDATPNSLMRALQSNSILWPNPSWSTQLFRKCMENPVFKRDFINRMADMINVAFNANRVNTRLSEYQAVYQPEIQKHFDRWNGGWAGNWIPSINKMKNFGNNRPNIVRQQIVDYFAEVTGTANVTLQANPAIGGSIHFSTVTPPSANLPWTGIYFTGVDIPMDAVPNRGYVFTSWSDAGLGTSRHAQVNLSANKTITANFIAGSNSTSPIVINEINYNSPDASNSGDWIELYNPNTSSVDVSGWYVEDESTFYYSLPNNTVIPPDGFILVLEDSLAFKAIYPGVNAPLLGNFGDGALGFKLSNGGETILLKNAAGTVIDSVKYDDTNPWPVSPDGNGPTLQLVAPNLDNALGINWVGQFATPGLPNNPSSMLNQSISFPAIADKLTTSAPFTITATASSGLPVTLGIVSGPATISGNTITLTGATGTVQVSANQAGNAQYNPAPEVINSFAVNTPALLNQTITFAAIPNKLTTSPAFTISATASSGLPVTFAIVSGPATISGNTITLTGATGTVQVSANQAGNAQYNPAPQVINSFTVTLPTLLNQTITFAAIPNKLTTSPAFSISATASSGLPVTFAIVSGPATISGNTITLTGATGTVQVSANQAGNAQYNPAPQVINSFTVTLPTLLNQTITFAAIPNKQTNSAPFTVTATASSGLPVSFSIVSGPATISGNTITLTGATGTVTVKASQAGNAQYNPAPDVLRTFTVSLPQLVYCNTLSDFPWHEWISKVQLNSINNVSGKSVYSNFTSINTTLLQRTDYPITLTTSFSWATANEFYRVWIDYDHNSVFDDTEIAYQGFLNAPANGTPTAILSGTISVPPSAPTGATRMRVSMKKGAYPTACETVPFGEAEDYTVTIASSLTAFTPTDYSHLFLDVRRDVERVVLSYGIATSEDITYTSLEKSVDDIHYDPLIFMDGLQAQSGIYYDEKPVEGINFYRAKFVLADTTLYTPVGQIDFQYLPDVVLYPNPARDQVNLYLYRHVGKPVEIIVTDLLGRQVYYEKSDELTTDIRTLDASNWSNGIYNIYVASDRLRPVTKQVIIFK